MDPQPADLQFSTRWMNGHQIVAIAGDIDACTAPAMLAYVLNAAADSNGGVGGSDLVMDLSAVTFMDASGLSALTRADAGARQAGRQLRLAAPTARVARLLAITRLDLHFDVYPSTEAATSQGASQPDSLASGTAVMPACPASTPTDLEPAAFVTRRPPVALEHAT
jgi:anti-sigma B factor antagonist